MNGKHPSSTVGRRGFTLVEMTTSLAILSILIVACGSIVMMAERATGDGATRNANQQKAADAASQMTDDLNVALNFTQRTATAATFTVPDRLGTGIPQTVSYSWDGVSGDSLLRQFNGGTASSILTGVQQLSLGFNTRMMGPAAAATEQVLAYHDAVSLLGSLADNKMTNKNWGSQYFVPTLPAGTSSYTITRVRLMLKSGSRLGDSMNVSLVVPGLLYRPTGATVATATVYESALSSSYEWIDVPFTGLSNQNPLQPLCIVMSSTSSSTDIGAIQVDQSLFNILSTADWSSSTNAGSSWSIGMGNTTARFYVFGTVP